MRLVNVPAGTRFGLPSRYPLPCLSFLLLVGRFPCFLLCEFVIDVLLEQTRIAPDDAASFHEDGRRTIHVKLPAVREAGIYGGPGLSTRHATLKGLDIDPGLASVVHHFCPDILCGDDFLVVINKVIYLPEGIGVLLIGASAREGCGAGPRMKRLDRKVLEDHANLPGIGRQQPSQSVMEIPADGALEV